MSGMANVSLIGNLGSDPREFTYGDGKKGASLNIGVTDKASKGETLWVNVSAFGKLGEICAQYLRKGSQVYVSGVPSVRAYTSKGGENRAAMNVVADKVTFLGSSERFSGGENTGRPAPGPAPDPAPQSNDDVPF